MPQMPEAAGAPVMPRPAATVMVVQPGGDGFEVFMVRRHQASKFAADVYVFPGGTIRPDDRLDEGRARAERLRLLADRLVYFSRWITPATSPRRFDTRFLVAELPLGQTAAHCQIETTEGLWISPGEALSRQADGDFPMMSVTREHLRR